MDNRIVAIRPPRRRAFNWAGYLLGVGLGGLFEGILLHQILQWHHVLGAVTRAPFGSAHMQIMADGMFMATMYAIVVAGLLSLLRSRHIFGERAADRLLAANLLIGFGAWQVADVLVLHWLLGLHRLRADVPYPWLWDAAWLLAFGVLFVAGGMLLRRHAIPPSFRDSGVSERNRARHRF